MANLDLGNIRSAVIRVSFLLTSRVEGLDEKQVEAATLELLLEHFTMAQAGWLIALAKLAWSRVSPRLNTPGARPGKVWEEVFAEIAESRSVADWKELAATMKCERIPRSWEAARA